MARSYHSRKTYTPEMLAPIVARCKSIAEVLGELGLCKSGGSHSHISRRIKEYGFDTSHFVRYPNRGLQHKGGGKRVTAEDLAVYNRRNGYREGADTLRRVLLDSGRRYQCVGPDCGLLSEWKGKPLVLEVDHINRDVFDNRLDNLRFLCPNCHSQTRGYAGRKPEEERTAKITLTSEVRIGPAYCECGSEIGMKSVRCRLCHQEKNLRLSKRYVKGSWPDNETLKAMLWERPATSVAVDLGVTSVAVKKWCNHRGIETPPRGYWAKLAAGKL